MLWFLFRPQAARTVLHSAEPVSQMLNDWKQIDFEGIARQALWTFSQSVEEDYELVNERKWTKPIGPVTLTGWISRLNGLVQYWQQNLNGL